MEMARQAKELLSLDRVLLMVTSDPPHKPVPGGVTCADRFRMAELACAGDTGIYACDVELSREGKSFTCDTLEIVRSMYPEADLFLIIGSDSLHDFLGWRSPEKILRYATIACLPRKGISDCDRSDADRIRETFGADVLLLDAAIPGISSTMIRERTHAFRSCADLVDPSVETYMISHGLYHSEEIRHQIRMLQRNLSRKRFLHSVRVVNLALQLAERWDADQRKTFLAALLHDCAKELSDEEMRLRSADTSGIRSVQHAFAGPAFARERFGVRDPEILEAIRLHCTGDAGMGLISQIVYLADAAERERIYPGVVQYRHALELGPDEAMQTVLRGAVRELRKNGKRVHPASERALDHFRKVVAT